MTILNTPSGEDQTPLEAVYAWISERGGFLDYENPKSPVIGLHVENGGVKEFESLEAAHAYIIEHG